MQALSHAAAAAAIFAAISVSPSSYAQNESPSGPSTQRDCSQNGVAAPPTGETTNQPLGERLSQSKGVICPPQGVDPEIVNKPPPGNPVTPVIPPPGSPGGDPSRQPK